MALSLETRHAYKSGLETKFLHFVIIVELE